MNNTESAFLSLLRAYETKLNEGTVCYKDAVYLLARAENMLLRFQEIQKSRDSWRTKYEKLRKKLKEQMIEI